MAVYVLGHTLAGNTFSSVNTTNLVGITDYPITISCLFNLEDCIAPAGSMNIVAVVNIAAGTTLGTHNGAHALVLRTGTSNGTTRIAASSINSYTNTAANAINGGGNNCSEWRFGAAVFTGATLRNSYGISTQGAVAAIGTNSTSRTPSGFNRLYIGDEIPALSQAGYKIKGAVQEVGVWNAVLTQDELVSMAKGTKPTKIRPSNLKVYIPGIRNIADFVGGVPFSLNGNVTIVDHFRRYG